MEEHVLDWYEKDQKHAEWRKKMRIKYAKLFFEHVVKDIVTPPPVTEDTATALHAEDQTHDFKEVDTSGDPSPVPPLTYGQCPNCVCTSCKTFFAGCKEEVPRQCFPTEARLRRKDVLKDIKEKGEKPNKRRKHVEEGNDDCGDSLKGLGPDVVLLGLDIQPDDDSGDEDHCDDIFV